MLDTTAAKQELVIKIQEKEVMNFRASWENEVPWEELKRENVVIVF